MEPLLNVLSSIFPPIDRKHMQILNRRRRPTDQFQIAFQLHHAPNRQRHDHGLERIDQMRSISLQKFSRIKPGQSVLIRGYFFLFGTGYLWFVLDHSHIVPRRTEKVFPACLDVFVRFNSRIIVAIDALIVKPYHGARQNTLIRPHDSLLSHR